jgi:hypothetical protein
VPLSTQGFDDWEAVAGRFSRMEQWSQMKIPRDFFSFTKTSALSGAEGGWQVRMRPKMQDVVHTGLH